MAPKSRVLKVKASELAAWGVEGKSVDEIVAAFLDTRPPLKPGEEPIIYDLTEALEGWITGIVGVDKLTKPRRR
jgi:hypothetical protein